MVYQNEQTLPARYF